MINVNSSQSNNVFKDFPQLKFGQPSVNVNSNLLTNKSDTVDVKTSSPDSNSIASVNVSDVKNKKNGKKGGVIAITTGTAILIAGILTVAITKGFSSSAYRKVNDAIAQLTEKIASGKSKSLLDKSTLALAKGTKAFLSGLKAVANFNAIKDSFVDRILYRTTKPLTKAADNITKLFKKFSYVSVDKAYDLLNKQTGDFCAYITRHASKIKVDDTLDFTQEITSKDGVTKTLGEWLKDIGIECEGLQSTFEKGFSKNARLSRDEVRQEGLKDLQERVWNALYHEDGGILNFRANANKFKTYITEDLSNDGKIKLRQEINGYRKEFTNNLDHNYSIFKTSLQEISNKLDINDKESRDLLGEISKKIKEYYYFSGPKESVDRAKIVDELNVKLANFNNVIQTSDKDLAVKSAIQKEIRIMTDDVLTSDQKGHVEKLKTIIKTLTECPVQNKKGELVKLFDENEAKAFEKSTDSLTGSANKACFMESEDFYDKNAEFAVGSAPSDVLGLLFPVGVAGYAISKGDNSQERISTTLTTGIPIVGSIGTMIYGTTRMLAGPKNLGLAFGVGFVLNFVGSACDKLYKKYQEKRSFTQMALDAYKNNPLFTQTNNKNI